MKPGGVTVFVGPTLPAAEVKRRLRCELRPPAAQGDVWRALQDAPRLIVLLDGVFEARPAVWHRELLDALDAGVRVVGAASMGALRAAELAPFGMQGVGQIYAAYRDGSLVDDAEVALLHAGAEHGHRPLTVPLVNVRHAATLARKQRVLSRAEAEALVVAARSIFYQERVWPHVLRRVGFGARTRARWDRFAARGLDDLKARDARECLGWASRWMDLKGQAPLPALASQPSHVRRWKIAQRLPDLARSAGSATFAVPAVAVHDRLRTLALAAWARSLGMRASPGDRAAEAERWWSEQGVAPSRRAAVLKARGMDAGDLQRLMDVRILERQALESAEQLLPDGPSRLEAAALAVWDVHPR